MDIDILVHKIVGQVSAVINLGWTDQPYYIRPNVYKKNDRDLIKAIKYIVENEIINDFEIIAFDKNGMELDLKNAYLSEEGKKLARKSKKSVYLKSALNKLTKKFFDLQNQMYNKIDKYESYSDERLLRMVESNSFPSTMDRAIVLKILKERGYIK